jgi:hypothetical protein
MIRHVRCLEVLGLKIKQYNLYLTNVKLVAMFKECHHTIEPKQG